VLHRPVESAVDSGRQAAKASPCDREAFCTCVRSGYLHIADAIVSRAAPSQRGCWRRWPLRPTSGLSKARSNRCFRPESVAGRCKSAARSSHRRT